jgi:acyl carrier protein
MSIKHFSKEEIINVAKDILKNDTFLGFRTADKLTPESSLRETLDVTSLEIAELIISLEERYHINMEWAETGKIDSLNDIYNAFITTIIRARKAHTALNTLQNQK